MTHHTSLVARHSIRAAFSAICLTFLALLLAAGNASAAKITAQTFRPLPFTSNHEASSTSSIGPEVKGLAVNSASTADAADGLIYVAASNRITVLDSDLEFVRAFGWDTIRPGAPGNIANNERQHLEVNASAGAFTLSYGGGTTAPLDFDATPSEVEGALNALPVMSSEQQIVTVRATGGTFTLSFDSDGPGGAPVETTVPIAFDAARGGAGTTPGTVAGALRALPSIDAVRIGFGPGDELGTSPYLIKFQGNLSGTDVPQLEVDDSNLTGGAATAEVQTTAQGNSPAVSVSGTPGDYTIEFDGPPLIDANVPQVGVDIGSLTGTAAITTVNHGAAFEICEDLLNCKHGSGIALGGGMSNPGQVAINQSDGSVYVADVNNRRIQKFDAEGEFLWATGKRVNAEASSADPDLCLAGEACKAGQSDGSEASFDGFNGLAASPADGRVYVGSRNDARVQVFEPDGTFDFMWGLGVGGGGELETCTSGCQAGQVTSNDPPAGLFYRVLDVAVGDQGQVYVADRSSVGQSPPPVTTQPDCIHRFNDPEDDPTDVSLFAPGEFVKTQFSEQGAPLGDGDMVGPIAVDPGPSASAADDTVYVVRDPSRPFRPHPGSGYEVLQIPAATGIAVEIHGQSEEFLFPGVQLAFDPDHGAFTGNRLFWAGVKPDTPEVGESSRTVTVLEDAEPPPLPEAEIEPVTSFDQTTATFAGEIDPNTNPTSYRFEYVDDDTYQADGESFANARRIPIEADASVGNGDDAELVTEGVVDLNPGMLYHVRLRARVTAGANGGSVVIGGPVSFTTASAPPEALAGPVSAKATSALLSGDVDPHGEETTYRFQYGTQGPCSANPCTSIPTQSIGSAGGAKHVSRQITGLDPNATYHYRLVVESDLGTEATADRSLVTIPQNRLPENRAWEKVTPDEKGNGSFGSRERQASASGDALAYNTEVGTGFPGDLANPTLNPHLSTRNADGSWKTEALAPKMLVGQVTDYSPLGYSDDLSRQLVRLAGAQGVPGSGDGIYIRDNLSGVFAEAAGPSRVYSFQSYFWTPSLDRIAFTSQDRPVTPETPLDGEKYLHTWNESESPELISRLPGGQIVPVSLTGPPDHRISEDGSRVFWVPELAADAYKDRGLYGTTEGEGTIKVSASERTVPDPIPPNSAPVYRGATPDGERVFFTSGEKLTDDSTATTTSNGSPVPELYRYDFSAPEGERLTDLTPAPDAPRGAEVQGAIDVSDEGDRAYFVARARLAPGGVQGQDNVYLWTEGAGVVHVATLDPTSDSGEPFAPGNTSEVSQIFPGGRSSNRTPMATPDGKRLVFRTASRLTASPTGGLRQVYVYDAATDRAECLSCPLSGAVPTAHARLGVERQGLTGGLAFSRHQLRNISADGERVFFQTATPLLDSDTNGKVDVYEWRDGQIHLISSGQYGGDSSFVDASEDGDSVFFATRERLVPADTDSVMDAYVARVDGIAPKASVPTPPCEGESCAPLPVAPNDPTPSSSTFRGPGNLKEKKAAKKPRCGKNKRQVKQRGKVRCVKKKAKRNKRKAAKRKAAAKRRAAKNMGRAGR